MAQLADNFIRYTYIEQERDSRSVEAMIDNGVFHIFLLAGKKWDISLDQITEDFKNFVVFHEIPSYVTGSIHSANRLADNGLVI